VSDDSENADNDRGDDSRADQPKRPQLIRHQTGRRREPPSENDEPEMGSRFPVSEKFPERNRPRPERRGCGGCLGGLIKTALVFVLLGILATLIYRGLDERDKLPDALRIPDIGRLSEWIESKGWLGNTTTKSTDWSGFAGADRSHRSPNFDSRRGADVTAIVLHSTESSSALSAVRHFENRASKVSAHYILGRDGKVFQLVDEAKQAWHCRGANGHTIGIEITSTRFQGISDAQTAILIELLVDIIKRHRVRREGIYGHDFTPGYSSTTSCPNMLFGGKRPENLERWKAIFLDPHLETPFL